MTSWDNTPRRLEDGSIFINSTPYHYQIWLAKAIKATVRSMPEEKRFVFINAWNEWAEGAHLEPDKKFGYGYLQACRNALQTTTQSIFSKNVEIPIEPRADVLLIIHAFYPELLDEILSFMPNISKKIDLLITTPHADRLRKESKLIHQYVNSTIVELPNIGRDIAPFLSVLPTVINKGYRYACKLHTKKTTHRKDGDIWRKDILSCLLGVEELDRIFIALEDENIALIGPQGHILPSERYWWKAENKLYVKQLAESLGLPKNFKFPFVAGSMFWFSPRLLEGLTFLPLSISDFGEEKGEVDGTLAHGIERFIGAYVYSTGKKIGEIDKQGNIYIVDYEKLLDINFPFAMPTEDPLPDL
jgi:lipopolysaccharide biosynthesis protein